MDRIRVTEVGVSHQMEAYTYQGDDGFPTAMVFSPVYCKTADGRGWFLPQGVRRRDEEDGFTYYAYRYNDANRLANRVRLVGSIDPDLWVEVQPFDLEAELQDEWEREQAERMGYPL